MKKRFTKKQLEIMKILWESDKPRIASDIVKENKNLNINTVQACLRSLVANEAIQIADIVYSGTVLTRSYIPVITKEEYLNSTCTDVFGNAKTNLLIQSLIESETNLEELDRLEKMIVQKKKELEKKVDK